MESPELNPPPSNDAIDAWLRTHLALSELPEADFSIRVGRKLRPRRRAIFFSPRLLWCLGGAAAGSVVAFLGGLDWARVSEDLLSLSSHLQQSAPGRIDFTPIVALVLSVAAVGYALKFGSGGAGRAKLEM